MCSKSYTCMDFKYTHVCESKLHNNYVYKKISMPCYYDNAMLNNAW